MKETEMRDPGSPRTDLPEGLSGQGGQVGLEGGQWALTTRRSLRAHSRFHRQKFFLFFFFQKLGSFLSFLHLAWDSWRAGLFGLPQVPPHWLPAWPMGRAHSKGMC